jgi:hypothetical protein
MIVKDLYKNKYLKYKNKYLNLQSQIGGTEMPVITRVIPIYSTNGFQVKINWTQPKSDIPNLNVFDYQIISTPRVNITKIIYQYGPNNFGAFVGGLQYNKSYNFVVIASHNKQSAQSAPSKEIKILTNVPIRPIINEVIIRNNDAEITWNFNEEYGCGLSAVTYKISVNSQLLEEKIQGNAKRAIIKDINTKFRNQRETYIISIIASNLNGDSQPSKEVIKENNINEGPTKISDLYVKYGNKCALVKWKMGDFGNDKITKYIITFTPLSFNFFNSDKKVISKTFENKKDLKNTRFVIDGLNNGENYNCNVKVYNNNKKYVEDSISEMMNFFYGNFPTDKGYSKDQLEKYLNEQEIKEEGIQNTKKEDEEKQYQANIVKDKAIIKFEQEQKKSIDMEINKETIKNCSKKINNTLLINEKIKLLKKISTDQQLHFDKLKFTYLNKNKQQDIFQPLEQISTEDSEQKINWVSDSDKNNKLLINKKIMLLYKICVDNKLDFNDLKDKYLNNEEQNFTEYLNQRELKLITNFKLTDTKISKKDEVMYGVDDEEASDDDREEEEEQEDQNDDGPLEDL